jgi:PAS domain S-box-containing protein
MNEVAFLLDDDKQIRFANDAALDFADVPLEEIKGRPIEPVTEEMAAPDEDPQRFLDAVNALLNNVEPDVGKWVQRPDGTEALSLEFDLYLESIGDVYAEQRLVPVDLYDGGKGVAVVSRDITARREKEEEIQTHLEQAQEIGNVGSWHIDLDEDSLHWSDECYRIFEMDPGKQMTYDQFLAAVHPDDRKKVTEAWTAALDGEPYETEHRITVDGEVKWVQEIAEVTFDEDGEATYGIGVVRDITEQKEREREISEQKRRYESLFNSISGAIVVTDLDECIRTCNPGFIDLFGYEIDDVEGDHISTITTDGAEVDLLFETRADLQESPVLNYRKKSGRIFPGESRTSPLRTHDNEIRGHVVHIIDVSDAQKNREQLQVLGRVFRHNIKNAMNVIMAQAEIVQDRGSSAVMPQAEKILETSRKFVEMAENQQRITEILTGNTETVKVDLVPVIKRTVTDLQGRYPDATIQTDLITECQVSTVREIADAIQELVQNAIIHSEKDHPSVDIRLRHTEAITELTIRDDGPGIPDQEWNVLTQEGDIEPLSHGTGLGLWFVDQVISQSNGTMAFDTNDSGGTTITVRLPSS